MEDQFFDGSFKGNDSEDDFDSFQNVTISETTEERYQWLSDIEKNLLKRFGPSSSSTQPSEELDLGIIQFSISQIC